MKTMQIGRLNKRVSLVALAVAEDDLGQETQKLKTIKTVWASLYPVRGTEYYEAAKIRAKTTFKCYLRYIPGVETNMYLKYKDTMYAIESVIDVNFEHKMLEIYCTEYTNKEVIQNVRWNDFT